MIDPRLTQGGFAITSLDVSTLILKDDKRFPWVILVPKYPHIQDLDELKPADLAQLFVEVTLCSKVMKAIWPIEKMNVASIGNMVPQCHIHIVGRRKDDILWPQPVWGLGAQEPYLRADAETILKKLKQQFENAATTR